jgi:hypothetical protein
MNTWKNILTGIVLVVALCLFAGFIPSSAGAQVSTASVSLTIIEPSGGENLPADMATYITWSYTGAPGPLSLKLGRPSGCDYAWETIISSTPVIWCSYRWIPRRPDQQNCKIRACSTWYPSICDESELFNIVY